MTRGTRRHAEPDAADPPALASGPDHSPDRVRRRWRPDHPPKVVGVDGRPDRHSADRGQSAIGPRSILNRESAFYAGITSIGPERVAVALKIQLLAHPI